MEVINSCSLLVFAVVPDGTALWVSECHAVNLDTSERQNILVFSPLFCLSIPISHILSSISVVWSSNLLLWAISYYLPYVQHPALLPRLCRYHLALACGIDVICVWVQQESELRATFALIVERHQRKSSQMKNSSNMVVFRVTQKHIFPQNCLQRKGIYWTSSVIIFLQSLPDSWTLEVFC